ncbi:uncharacterized protein BO80DRAFT_283701 [Aspergillus ibericus CBS 121593]|uniref:Uncharacterized protein n=1 Tax=Aspergillus ibericus CBS 121593 TaxID=1448316 RepID=A0A395H984_9EURO|nr:hypothetical protein BO80DRAFT_283701 [Aspergillus ibericus CBS 121593]RAL03448.1 hypothetical protein BO80DRAFT_283701 [Aspergillus ibericus CBS 121593]
MGSQSQDSGPNRRRQSLSLSLAIRPSLTRRNRLSPPPPNCEESVHYPVFNPRNPRHNPSVASSPWHQDDYYLPEPSNSARSIRWMQSLPKRSLRKVHSGLLSFRPGHRRRSILAHPSRSDDIPSLWSSTDSAKDSSDQQGTLYSSTVSEASTEEDVEFGTDLQRISCNYAPEPDGDMDRYLRSLPASFAWEDGTLSSGSTIGPSCRSEVLTPTVSKTHSTRSPSTRTAEIGSHDTAPRDGISGDSTGKEMSAPSGNPQPIASIASPRSPSESYFSRSTGSDVEGLCITAAVPSNGGAAKPQLPSETVETDRGASSDSCKSTCNMLSVPIIEINSCRPVMTSTSRDSYASESPLILDAELAMESLELCERLELNEGHSGDDSASLPDSLVYTQSQSPEAVHSSNIRLAEAPLPDNQESNYGGNTTDHTADMRDNSGPQGRSAPCNNFTENNPFTTGGADHPNDQDTDEVSVLQSQSSQDDLASLLALRDEYFLVDKSNDLHPDRGNNATKAERSFSGDGCLYSGPGLDRNSSTRVHDIPEIIGPRTPVQGRATRSFRRERDTSDSDEYLVTYPVIQRHYFP